MGIKKFCFMMRTFSVLELVSDASVKEWRLCPIKVNDHLISPGSAAFQPGHVTLGSKPQISKSYTFVYYEYSDNDFCQGVAFTTAQRDSLVNNVTTYTIFPYSQYLRVSSLMGYAHRRDVIDNWMYEMKILISTATHTSLDTEIPVAWKASITSPIYMKDSKNGVANNRPICLTSMVCKIQDKKGESKHPPTLESGFLL